MRVLVTGATGFLGKYVIEELSNNGYEIIATGRNEKRLEEYAGRGFRTLKASLSELAEHRQECDAVVHCAALSSMWGRWEDFYEHNVVGTRHVVEFCQSNNVSQLIHISSPSIYTQKKDGISISEETPLPRQSLNGYIKSKVLAEEIIQQVSDNMKTVILRPRGIIGIGDSSIVPRLIKVNQSFFLPLFNEGHNLVDVTCVENVAVAIRCAIESERAHGRIYNITNGEPREFRVLTDQLFKAIGHKPKYKPRNVKVMYAAAALIETIFRLTRMRREPPITRYSVSTLGYSHTLDISRACDELGYKPVKSLDEGIQAYGRDFRKQYS